MPAVFVRCWWRCYIQMLRYCRHPCRVPCFSILRRCWPCWCAFGVVSLYSAHNGQSAPSIGGRVASGGVSVRVGVSFVAGGAAYPPHPTPKTRTRNLGCLSKNFFWNFIFYIFAFVIEVFKPVGVVSSFAGFFRVNSQEIVYFLNVGVEFNSRLLVFGYFLVVFRRFCVLDEGLYVLHWESV